MGSAAKEVLYVDGNQIDDHLFEISTSKGIKTYKKDHLGSIVNSGILLILCSNYGRQRSVIPKLK